MIVIKIAFHIRFCLVFKVITTVYDWCIAKSRTVTFSCLYLPVFKKLIFYGCHFIRIKMLYRNRILLSFYSIHLIRMSYLWVYAIIKHLIPFVKWILLYLIRYGPINGLAVCTWENGIALRKCAYIHSLQRSFWYNVMVLKDSFCIELIYLRLPTTLHISIKAVHFQ